MMITKFLYKNNRLETSTSSHLKMRFVKIFDGLPRFSVALQHIDLIPKFLGSNTGIVNFSDA